MNLASIFIYPVKGFAGIELESAYVELRGLKFDRRWMVVDESDLFLSQRKVAKMATIGVRLEPNKVFLNRDGQSPFSFDMEPEGPPRMVQVWNDLVETVEVGPEANAWVSEALGQECRLVNLPDSTLRNTNPQFSSTGDHVSFADGFPITLATEASLQDLNRRLAEPIPMDRFRPNLVISGDLEAWEEDGWGEVKIAGVVFRMAKPCGRCVVTTINQRTGRSSSQEPLTTMATFRKKGASLDFSINLIPESEGDISTGSKLTVERSRPGNESSRAQRAG